MKNQKAAVRTIYKGDDASAANFSFACDFSHDNRFFSSSSPDGSISIYDLGLGKETKKLPGSRPFTELIMNPGDTRLACASSEDPRVEIRDIASGQTLLTLNCPTNVSAVNWSPDGKRLATACLDFSIYIWDAETGRRLSTLEGHFTYIQSLAFNHRGDLLVSAGYDGIRLWNSYAGRPLVSFRGSSWQIQFSPDDRRLVGWQDGAHYGSLEVASSRECRELYVPRDGRYTAGPTFSADGRILAASSNSKARFWDAVSGKEIGSFQSKDQGNLIFNPDGRSLITVDPDDGVYERSLEQLGDAASSVYRLGKPRRFFDAADVWERRLVQMAGFWRWRNSRRPCSYF